MVNVVVNPVNTVNVRIGQNKPKVVSVATPANQGFDIVNYELIATEGQTEFFVNGGYTVGNISVYINGILLSNTDFDSSNGRTIILYIPASSGDNITISKWASGIVSAKSNYVTLNDVSITSNTVSTTTNIANQVLDVVDIRLYRSAKYLIQVTSGSDSQTSEVLLIHDGINVFVTEYGLIYTDIALMTYDGVINGFNAELLMSPVNSVNNIKIYKTSTIL
jgi:hypothetical protein